MTVFQIRFHHPGEGSWRNEAAHEELDRRLRLGDLFGGNPGSAESREHRNLRPTRPLREGKDGDLTELCAGTPMCH